MRLLGSFVVSIAILLSGCAGQLLVFDDEQNQIRGLPFRAAEVYVKTGNYTKYTKGGDCAKTPFVHAISLATGAKYYVAVKTAQFSKTAFYIKYGDSGIVSEIGLDSEPAAADTLKATNDLIKTIFPSLSQPAAMAALGVGGALPVAQACDTGESDVVFIKFDEYVKQQGK